MLDRFKAFWQGKALAPFINLFIKLGISPDDVDVLHSDTAIAPLGMDTYGSRSLPVGGVAIAMACDKVIDKAAQIAAHQLEASTEDLEYRAGTFSVSETTVSRWSGTRSGVV